MTQLISKPKQVLRNLEELKISLSRNDDKMAAKSLLKNGRVFVATYRKEEWIFAPSRFAGYKKNSIQKHKELIASRIADGRQTEQIFKKLFSSVKNEHELYSTIDKAFLEMCQKHKIIPSKNHRERRYHLFSSDISHLEFSTRRLTGQLSESDHVKSMINTTLATVKNSGTTTKVNRKVKNLDMSKDELETLLTKLLQQQNWNCALTKISMTKNGNPAFFPSLDRINSDGHYTTNNLQVVCRFVNKWKSDQPNDEFLSLLKLVKSN